ncbi:hypothetical protein GYH30_048038 [Glycine max]|nr:hypothetical protein GYH30_048038 [Glycine max]
MESSTGSTRVLSENTKEEEDLLLRSTRKVKCKPSEGEADRHMEVEDKGEGIKVANPYKEKLLMNGGVVPFSQYDKHFFGQLDMEIPTLPLLKKDKDCFPKIPISNEEFMD